MYWESKNNATWFEPSINDAVEKLQYAYYNFEKLNEIIESQKKIIHEKYSWNTVVKQFIGLCK